MPTESTPPSSEYTLHCFAQSGNAYKVALILELAEANWSPRWVDFFNGETRSPAYRAINSMGEVPVLEHRGQVISQSGVILDYLATTLGKFGANDDAERREILRWTLWDNHKLTANIATLRFLVSFVPAAKTDPAVLEFLRGRVKAAFKVLDTHMATRSFVVAERLTIADLSLIGYLYFADEFGVEWKDYPGVGAWIARIAATPRWKHPYDLMPGHPLPAKTP